jgi:hypothetical protein
MSLFFTEQFHPLSLPCASYTSHLPPPAAGRQPPQKPEREIHSTMHHAPQIHYWHRQSGGGNNHGLGRARNPGSSFGLPPGQDYYVPPRHCAYDCLVKMLHLQVYTHVRAVARRRGAGRPTAATKTIGVLRLGSNGIFSCKKMTIMQFVSRKK